MLAPPRASLLPRTNPDAPVGTRVTGGGGGGHEAITGSPSREVWRQCGLLVRVHMNMDTIDNGHLRLTASRGEMHKLHVCMYVPARDPCPYMRIRL